MSTTPGCLGLQKQQQKQIKINAKGKIAIINRIVNNLQLATASNAI
jgi:hypothetical protein